MLRIICLYEVHGMPMPRGIGAAIMGGGTIIHLLTACCTTRIDGLDGDEDNIFFSQSITRQSKPLDIAAHSGLIG